MPHTLGCADDGEAGWVVLLRGTAIDGARVSAGQVTVELRAGRMLAAATSLMAGATEYAGLIPDWHEAERQAFLDECDRFVRMLNKNLHVQGGR